LTIDGAARTLRSAAPTLGEALWENGIQVFEGDRLEPSAETALEGPLHASLRRGREIQIEADGALIKPRVVASTVGEALAQAGVGLLGLDYAQPGVESALPDDGQVKVIRVVEQVIVEQKPLAFETLYQPDAELEIDNTRLITAGSYGVLVSRVRIRTEDGVEKDRLVEGEWQAHAPEPRVIGYGTKIVIRTLDTPSGPVEYWRAVDMFVTSYSPCRLGPGVDRCGYHTAIGYKVEKGIAAVILSWFRYMRETQVYIPGYGSAIIADTGGGIPGRYWIDVAYSDDDYVPWARWRTIYFLTPIPDNIMYILD
jgi:3D (Asp-Asp-Asp) domain-containing protein